MNIIDLRKKLLQSSTERRVYVDRRKVFYQFGSPEWKEYMKNNKLECLEEERRKIIRRAADRELTEKIESTDSEKPYRRIFLTPNEKKLLHDIYFTDFEDSSDSN